MNEIKIIKKNSRFHYSHKMRQQFLVRQIKVFRPHSTKFYDFLMRINQKKKI